MSFTPHMPVAGEWWMIAAAVLCGCACGLVGSYLVLRRLSLLGDALTHAILPGLAGAFLLTGTRDVVPMLLGALLVGLLTSGTSAALTRHARVPPDAALGVVFTSLFALGVLMISAAAHRVDLDPSCVLYGTLESLALADPGQAPRPVLVLAGALVINAGVMGLLHKEVKLTAFDPALGASMGIATGAVHFAMLTLITATSVASFEAVGSVLVIAMLVGPAATARLLTRSYPRMLAFSGMLGAFAGLLGTLGALWLDTSVAGAVSTAVGLLFALAVLFAPREGWVAVRLRRLDLALRVRGEDLLLGLLRREENPANPHLPRRERQAGVLMRLATRRLLSAGLIEHASAPAAGPTLTPAGRDEARRLLRAHRLWETYLARDWNVAPDHVHDPSHRTEHFLSPQLVEQLDRRLGTSVDPQGKPIPPAPGTHRDAPRA